MDFSEALQVLKDGKAVARTSWPVHTWLVLVPGSSVTVAADRPLGAALPQHVGGLVEYGAHIDKVRAAPYGRVEPWVPTHAALLANDWEVQGG